MPIHPPVEHSYKHHITAVSPRFLNISLHKYAISVLYIYFFLLRSRHSSVGIATGYGMDDQEGREFESR
jgi:hypothetical protein